MISILESSAYFGAMLSLVAYGVGYLLKKKFKYAIFNPLLISIVLTMLSLIVFNIDYQKYNASASLLSFFLTPATVCLAIPLYQQIILLKQYKKAIILGILSGVITSLVCVLIGSIIFNLSHETYVTLLPKSITTAIGMGVCDELGGYVSLTVAVIIITGIFGNIFCEMLLKIFKIDEPIAKGVAIGTSAHAMGTAKALELGEIEGAMSSLSIAVSGLITVVGASIFAMIR